MGFLDLLNIRHSFTPWFWRNDTNNAFIDAYCSSLDETNGKDSELDELKKQVIYSAEKINLEAFCNDNYDNTLRRIYITQTTSPNDVFLGLDVEEPDGVVFIGKDSEGSSGEIFLGLDGEGGGTNTVTVHVPTVLNAFNDTIKQGVENYVRLTILVEIVNF